MQQLLEMWVRSLGLEDPLEEGMATCRSTLARRIPRTEESGRLLSMQSQRIGHDWACEHTPHVTDFKGKTLLFPSLCSRTSHMCLCTMFVVLNDVWSPDITAVFPVRKLKCREVQKCPRYVANKWQSRNSNYKFQRICCFLSTMMPPPHALWMGQLVRWKPHCLSFESIQPGAQHLPPCLNFSLGSKSPLQGIFFLYHLFDSFTIIQFSLEICLFLQAVHKHLEGRSNLFILHSTVPSIQ